MFQTDSESDEVTRRLQTIPGVASITSSAIAATLPEVAT
jgi:hypothetical protein